MLKVSLDEGYVFDILSINQVKITQADTDAKKQTARTAYVQLVEEISEQLGAEKLTRILTSEEYNMLLSANLLTFQLVENARNAKDGLAKEVDEANISRYNAKVTLQRQFFGTEPTEVKTQIS